MTATITEARDDILGRFRTAWLADPLSAPIAVKWPDVAQGEFPPKTEDADKNVIPWARITVLHNPGAGGESAISGDGGVAARRRYTRLGTVTVNIFTARGDGRTLSDQLVIIAMRAFESQRTPNGVIFRNVRPTGVGKDGAYYQANVVCDFEYDEVR